MRAAFLLLPAFLILSSPESRSSDNSLRPDPSSLARTIRSSLVAIQPAGRNGETSGIGSGFIISPDGLIATSFHVIGEGRALTIETSDGQSLEVTGVHAWDRRTDLAILRVSASNLPALTLAESDRVQQGDYAAAMGNPLGLRFSMVEGLVSARQEVEGRPMLQLSMPIERGNSGGPVIDRHGHVIGVVALKSTLTENLGFAAPSSQLKALLSRPTPVAMSAWLRIGALNPKLWKPGGGQWSQRAGTIRARGRQPDSFGGRTLCFHLPDAPPIPCEIAVRVRLNDESGAAGLIFCADGKDRHYGFYPSSGGLRLTRFDGPDVYSWTILAQTASDAYLPGAWNHLRVRIEAERIVCFLNGREVISSPDSELRSGLAGLCKFRDTEAEFKDFQMGTDLSGKSIDDSPAAPIIARLSSGTPLSPEDQRLLASESSSTRQLAEREAAALEKRAATLRTAAAQAHADRIATDLATLLAKPSESPGDLPRAALLLACLDNPELNAEPTLAEIDRLAAELEASLTTEDRSSPVAKLQALNRWMFQTNGFHGSRDELESRSNSYLNEVVDDREGLPITLSILHREFGRRIGLDIVGVSFPGRFMNRLGTSKPEDTTGPVIDVFDDGRMLTPDEASAFILDFSGELPGTESWQPATPRAIILRMLNNLAASAGPAEADALLRYLDTALAIDPASPTPRLQRLLVHARADRPDDALADISWFLEHQPEGIDLDRLRDLAASLRSRR
jgi:serine protease Do